MSAREEAERLRSTCRAADAERKRLSRQLADLAEQAAGAQAAMLCISKPCSLYP